MFTLFDVLRHVWYVIVTLGIPGNILSAIVWLRRHVTSKNSSAVYLAALAIDDLVYLFFALIIRGFTCRDGWFCDSVLYLSEIASILEPLLVQGFSVERLIAILRPLQVRCIRCTLTHTIT